MIFSDIKRVIEQIGRDKNIPMGILIKALEEALVSAARKKMGPDVEIEVAYNEKTGDIEVFQFKDVVEEVEDPELEITLKEGRELDPECEIGDSLGIKLDTTSFGRIAAQSAKQVIIQKLRDAERNAVYDSFIDREGEIINGIVQRFDRDDIIVNLGQAEAVLPAREQIKNETYRRGDRIRANIMKVLHESRGPQIVLTRTHPDFLINLFKTEVPEISEGVVKIHSAAREPGVRAKIAVSSSESNVDPVGSCVGVKGSRVQTVVQELRGEKIDIVLWNPDTARFVCNSLAPAEITRVVIDEDNKSMEVIVPDEFLSIAIGKSGQNVRLAARLTGWHLDVKSEAAYSLAMKEGYDSLMGVPGIGLELAEKLYSGGYSSPEDLKDISAAELSQIDGINEEEAQVIINSASDMYENSNPASETEEEYEDDNSEEENFQSEIENDNDMDNEEPETEDEEK
ncbi:MAG: transcription termination/antitermination protein NusA [Desulfobacteraceae bacterium]|nr:transcription termination/antitermination protein NusA [Desulfobacteraceae bacterium]MCB9494819.1 transcription termination/antitermination protein NusA [Desulfobacteraceae bacterium]